MELGIEGWEQNRTHWAVKDVDLLTELKNAGLLTKTQLARLLAHFGNPDSNGRIIPSAVAPTAFNFSGLSQEADLVSVMMPFDSAFDTVFTTIKSACTAAGLRCSRADEIWQDSVVIQDIASLIYRSRIVVADFTGRNPNVMYETGIAHTIGRQVVPLSQSAEDVPFDLRHHRFLKYFSNDDGLRKMQQTLTERLKSLKSMQLPTANSSAATSTPKTVPPKRLPILELDPQGFYIEKGNGRKVCGRCWDKDKQRITLVPRRKDGPASAMATGGGRVSGYASWTELLNCPDCGTDYAPVQMSKEF